MSRSAPIEEAILEFLKDWKESKDNDGNSPSYQQIAEAIGKYPADVRKRILSLQHKGMVRINKNKKICLTNGKYKIDDEIAYDYTYSPINVGIDDHQALP